MNGSSSNAIEEDAWEWASAFGEDRYGLFADFEYKGAMQRFRWIEAGSFMMGSPASEVGHYGPEGPQHLVHHTVGFWLADTPCTQALWEAVMGENPSHFRGVAERPVERVSFEDVQRFFAKLNGGEIEAPFYFPTEAQWEYACRAGSETSTYAGETVAWDDGWTSKLRAFAWFKDNSDGTTLSRTG